MPFDPFEATVDSIHQAMRDGQVTCRQLVEYYVNRIKAYDRQEPALNAIETINPAAFDEADRLDAEFRASNLRGPLHGIPVVIKDQVETRDMPTTFSSALFRGFETGRDATVVARLRAAGALILANIVAAIPARIAARTPTALLLRTE